MKRLILIAAVVLGVLALLAVSARAFLPGLGERAFARQVSERVGRDRLGELPDGLHVMFCGTGSPLPDPTRAQACVAVIAGERIFVVDSGSGSVANLLLSGLPAGAIEAAFLTHFHSDHVSDLGDLGLQRWIGRAAEAPLPVYGPPGVEGVVDGFNAAYALDSTYRTGHHGAAIAPPAGRGLAASIFEPGDGTAPVTVYQDDGLAVRAVRVDHAPADPAVAYRFDHAGRSLVISGDLHAGRSPGFAVLSEGADVLIVEALEPRMVAPITQAASDRGLASLATITVDILDYHTTPAGAAEAATASGTRALVLTHVVPPVPSRLMEPAFLREARARFDGPVRLARDGDVIRLPAGSDAVEFAHWR